MDSTALLHSFYCTNYSKFMVETPGIVGMNTAVLSRFSKLRLMNGGRHISFQNKHGGMLIKCAKSSETAATTKSGDSSQKGSTKQNLKTTFPGGLEALLDEVCDDTEIAELKLKVGDFEMHLKRNIETQAPLPAVPPMTPPPIPGEPMTDSTLAVSAPSPSKSSSEKFSPFTNVSAEKSAKLAALEASGSIGYVLVSSPTVGSFRHSRTLKGKRQPPICKEGDLIKEGQVIGYLDQFGTELPVRSDVAGEVLKVLFDNGEPVGYGDPLIAVLPSFHGINIE